MTTIGIVTQARMTSTRLPGKVLMSAGGRTMLEHHIRRLRRSGLPVIVATTGNAGDAAIVEEARRLATRVSRGSETDVLSRYAAAAREHALDVVVRVTSDCPLVDGELVAKGVNEFLRSDASYVSNVVRRTYPRGFDFEVFRAADLYRAEEMATSAFDREHVTPFIRANAEVVRDVVRPDDASQFRVTVDTAEDLAAVRALIEEYDAASLDGDGIIEILTRHPEIARINAEVRQKST